MATVFKYRLKGFMELGKRASEGVCVQEMTLPPPGQPYSRKYLKTIGHILDYIRYFAVSVVCVEVLSVITKHRRCTPFSKALDILGSN